MRTDDPNGGDPRIWDHHPAILHCARQLDELTRWRVRPDDIDGKLRRLTPVAMHELLLEQVPDLAPSQTQTYRYFNRKALPDVVLIYEISRLVGKSPQWFLPVVAPVSSLHARVCPPL